MRKKLLCLLIAGTITASICIGCGNTDTEPTAQTETTESTEQPTTEPNITETVAPTEQPTVEPAAPAEEVETTEQSEESAEPVEEPAETLTETPAVVDEPQAQYTYTDLSATMYAQQNVNVRDLPSTDGNKLGGLSTNQEVAVTGQCNETSWYRFEYNGSVAYVSNNYLGDSQVEVAQASAQSNTSLESFPYPLSTVLGSPSEGYYVYFVNGINNDLTFSESIRAWSLMIDDLIASGRSGGDQYLAESYTVVGTYAEGKVEKYHVKYK